MRWANEAILGNSNVYKNGMVDNESYNGQIAAFSVAIAMSGLKPTMALYYSGSEKSNIDKKNIIELLASIYNKDEENKNEQLDEKELGKALFKLVINANENEEPELRRHLIEYAIALKLAIRTFKFEES